MLEHDDKKIIKNRKLNKAQLFKKNYVNKFKKTKRLNFNKGEFLVFHPDLLHGGSLNKSNKSRVSMEMRIYQDNKVSYIPIKRGLKT